MPIYATISFVIVLTFQIEFFSSVALDALERRWRPSSAAAQMQMSIDRPNDV